MNSMIQFVKKQKTIRNMILVYYTNFLLLLIYLLSESTFKFAFIINILLFFLSIYFFYFFTRRLSYIAIEETKSIIYAKHKQMQQQHLEAIKENNNSVNTIKKKLYMEADMWRLQHNECIQQEMIKELISKQISFTEINYCENPFIDAMLYNKLVLAKKQNIQIYTQIIAPSNLNIVSIDLISLFTNLIDNAIEATMKANQPFLSIEFYPVASCFVLKVTNSKHKDDYIDLSISRSSKDKQFEHGIGLQIIKNIVKKYDGNIYLDQSEELASFQIVGLNIHTRLNDNAKKSNKI